MSGPAAPAGPAHCVWIVSKYTTPREYGFETRLFAMARRFAARGRDVVIVSSDANHLAAVPRFPARYTTEVLGGCRVRWIRTARYTRTASLRRLWSWLDFERKLLAMPTADLPRPDVIVVSSLSLFTIVTGAWLRRRFGCKLVFEVRDIWPLTMTEEGGFSRWHPLALLMGWVERFGYRRSDLIVGTMPNLAEHVADVCGSPVPCACVPFGFEPPVHAAPADDEPSILDGVVPPGTFVVGYAGSIGVTNALDTIVSCARALRDDPRIFFVILGDGDSRSRHIEETRDLPNIVFPGRVERARVQAALRRCDLLYFAVHKSAVWRFGLSLNKLIDYMMAAKPIVGSYSGYPSMLDEAGCGEFVPAADVGALRDAVVRFSRMPRERLDATGEAGRRWLMAHRSWDVLADDYLRLLDDLCRAGGAAA